MSFSIAFYQVQCDEPGCRTYMSFSLSATAVPHVYQMTPEAANGAYELHGGEILPDGKHRCPSCRAKLGTQNSLKPDDYRRIFDRPVPNLLKPVFDTIDAAKAYRAAEQDGTPRLWRGKSLQDLASRLDDTLEVIFPEAEA
jgi:hypothetical protein